MVLGSLLRKVQDMGDAKMETTLSLNTVRLVVTFG